MKNLTRLALSFSAASVLALTPAPKLHATSANNSNHFKSNDTILVQTIGTTKFDEAEIAQNESVANIVIDIFNEYLYDSVMTSIDTNPDIAQFMDDQNIVQVNSQTLGKIIIDPDMKAEFFNQVKFGYQLLVENKHPLLASITEDLEGLVNIGLIASGKTMADIEPDAQNKFTKAVEDSYVLSARYGSYLLESGTYKKYLDDIPAEEGIFNLTQYIASTLYKAGKDFTALYDDKDISPDAARERFRGTVKRAFDDIDPSIQDNSIRKNKAFNMSNV